MRVLLLSLILFVLCSGAFAESASLANSTQAFVVTTESWNSIHGSAQLFERKKTKSKWKPAGESFPVVIGKNGLAFAEDFAREQSLAGNANNKREGDGKSPAGMFSLTEMFGQVAQQTGLPFTVLTPATECVDDSASRSYNRVVNNQQTAVDWNSSEKMLAVGAPYELGVVVAHNTPAKAQMGSCIFLHIWTNADTGTSGCTAMEKINLEDVVKRLDAKRNPILIQFPIDVYRGNQKQWKLPKLK
jgi:D-alanyl-D-alanine dipeptidase